MMTDNFSRGNEIIFKGLHEMAIIFLMIARPDEAVIYYLKC